MHNERGIRPVLLIRHVVAIATLAAAWFFLKRWYVYQSTADYLLFVLLGGSGFGIAAWNKLGGLAHGVRPFRWAFAGGLILLAVPWSEYFRKALPDARQDWSRELFLRAVCLYGLLAFLSLFPNLRRRVSLGIVRAIDSLSRRKIVRLIPLVFFCFSSWIVLVQYERIPLVQDAAAHLFQAKIFRAGHLFAPSPPVPEAFSSDGDMLVLRNGRWYSSYLPGFSLLLAFAMLLKFEWLICPAMGAATIAVWMAYCERWHDRRISLVLGIVCLLSPMILLMSSNLMIHTAELFYASSLIYLCRKDTEEPTTRRAWLIGMIIFLAMITRGFSLLPFIAPVVACTVGLRLRSGFLKLAVPIGIGLIAGGVAIALFQWQTTGSPWIAGYSLEGSQSQFFGFKGEFLGQTHTPLRGLENVSNNLLGMDSWLTGWPTGCLFFLLLFVLSEKKMTTWDLILISSCALLSVFYFFYVFQDLVIGPRFWFPMTPILLLFVVRSIFSDDPKISAFSVSLGAVSICIFVLFYLPGYLKLYAPQGQQIGQLHRALSEARSTRAVVALDPRVEQTYVNWNDPFLRENLIITNKLGLNNSELLKAFPGRPILYFRETKVVKEFPSSSGYHLETTPDPNPPGYFSLQDLALLIESANDFLRHDIFDSGYSMFFYGSTGADQLAFLQHLSASAPKVQPYRNALRFSLIHLAWAILMPKDAFERNGNSWVQGFDLQAFRVELDASSRYAKQARDVGQGLQQQLVRVRRRIDRNQDGRLADSEVEAFLSEKLRILEIK
jgi:hypothetical protein